MVWCRLWLGNSIPSRESPVPSCDNFVWYQQCDTPAGGIRIPDHSSSDAPPKFHHCFAIWVTFDKEHGNKQAIYSIYYVPIFAMQKEEPSRIRTCFRIRAKDRARDSKYESSKPSPSKAWSIVPETTNATSRFLEKFGSIILWNSRYPTVFHTALYIHTFLIRRR